MPDLLFRGYVNEYGEADPVYIYEKASHFVESLQRTKMDEREIIIKLFSNSCPADLPENVHMNIDLLSRLTQFSETKLLRLFSGLRSLGFYARAVKRRKEKGHLGEDRIISVEWHDMAAEPGKEVNATEVAHQMLNISDFAHCENCALEALRRLDFSHLATATLNMEGQNATTGRRIPNIGRELRKIHSVRVAMGKKRKP